MAAIPCPDYITDPVGAVPKRLTCTNRTCLANRWANFVASIDLSPDQKDEAGAGVLAWSLWDIPTSHAAQIDDDRGEDLICVAVRDRVYWLDWERWQDEWYWNSYAPIFRMVRFGPIPANDTATERSGYNLTTLKRFREFQWNLKDGATGAPEALWTVRVAEWDNEAATERSTTRRTNGRMRAKLSTKGKAFVITLEHKANEPINLDSWTATWDDLGKRIREASVA